MPIAALWPLPPQAVAAAPVAPVYSAADFLAALQNLMPKGRAWPRDAEAVETALLAGIAAAQAAAHARQAGLLADAFPATAEFLLPEWEASLGLPDPCIGIPATVAARQALVVSRLAARGGIAGSQSIGQMTAAAAALGFTVTIEEFTDAAAGQLAAGQPLYGAQPLRPRDWFRAGDPVGTPLADWAVFTAPGDWAFALRIHAGGAVVGYAEVGTFAAGDPLADWSEAALTTERFATVGTFAAGDPLASWGAPILECTLRKMAPAQSCLLFAYH